jgi:hypothetical protein
MIRNKINCDKETLNKLNSKYSWIPNETSIRPSVDDISKKNELIDYINKTWLSTKDYILNNVFNESKMSNEHFNFVVRYDSDKWVFSECIFRYNLPKYANHYILWYSGQNYYYNFDDEVINNKIEEELSKFLNHNYFDFAWYKNPKPSVPEFYHIQVFWTLTK